MERNSVIVRIFGRFVVNRGPTITVDVRLDLGETPTKGPLKVRATSSPSCTTVHLLQVKFCITIHLVAKHSA